MSRAFATRKPTPKRTRVPLRTGWRFTAGSYAKGHKNGPYTFSAPARQVRVEKLPLIDADHFRLVADVLQELIGILHGLRRDSHVAVRHDVVFAEAVVDGRFENLDLLSRDLRSAQAADELLALAAEHAAGDDFDPAVMRFFPDNVHDHPRRLHIAKARRPRIRVIRKSDSRLIFAGFGVDPNLVPLVDEGRHLNDEAGFERGRLDLRARRRALDSRRRLLDEEIDGGRQLDSDRFDVVELDANDRVGHEIVDRLAQRFVRDVDLLVGRRVHEVIMVGVVVQILHLALVERRALDVLLSAEFLVRERQRPDVAQPRLNVGSLVARRQMVQIEDTEQVGSQLDEHAFSETRGLNGIHVSGWRCPWRLALGPWSVLSPWSSLDPGPWSSLAFYAQDQGQRTKDAKDQGRTKE